MRWAFLFLLILLLFPAPPVFAGPGGQNCDKARSSADVMRCLTRENEQAQADLNKAFDTLSMQKSGDDLTRVKDTQAQWIKYRDQDCAFETEHLETESLKRLESLRCINRLTQERIVAIENSLEKSVEDEIIGEATTQPRWMNALAEDYPDVFWRYGTSVEGDADCDGEMEYMMTGLRQTEESGGLEPLVSISENPATGRPQSAVIVLPQAKDAEEDETLEQCGALLEIEFKAVEVEAVETTEQSEEQPEEQVSECANQILIHTVNCPQRILYWGGDSYALKE